MKCYRCKRHGIDSTMEKYNGVASCPNCGRTVTYRLKSDWHYEPNIQLGCGMKILLGLLAVLIICGMIIANPWLLLILLIPLFIWIIRLSNSDDDD